MPMISANDGTQLYVKDWGQGRPVVLIHGWPLTADSWETRPWAWPRRAIASSAMTAADSAGPNSLGTAMITTRCRTIWPR